MNKDHYEQCLSELILKSRVLYDDLVYANKVLEKATLAANEAEGLRLNAKQALGVAKMDISYVNKAIIDMIVNEKFAVKDGE